MAYVCAHVREKVMFEVYGGESMNDQYGRFFVFSHLLSILHFSTCIFLLAFLVYVVKDDRNDSFSTPLFIYMIRKAD